MRPDLLLVIHRALKTRLSSVISTGVIENYVDQVLDTFESQNIFAATLLEPDFDPADLANELRVFASSASLFGAEFAGGTTAEPELRTTLVADADRAAAASSATLSNRVVQDMRLNLFNVITDLDARIRVGEAEFSRVQLRPQLVADSQRITDQRISTVAELQTTRLSAAGGLQSLSAQGAVFYRWSAVLLDSCPICTALDGQTFLVQPSLEQITGALQSESDDEIRERQPFPPQNRTAIEEFLGMTSADIQAAGYAVPPAHPFCRCLVTTV